MVNKALCINVLALLVTPTVFNNGCNPGGPKKTTPTITWAAPAAITYPTPLGSTQLDATSSVPGAFVYTPPAGTVLNAGTQTLSVAFTPSDTTKYNTASANVSLTVNKATPTITWAAPAPITQGTALSATQLDATASVAGAFVYTPPASTVLSTGTQSLSVAFTPTDSANYTSASDSVAITVNAASGGIGSSGGTVNGFYGASVTVPAGALSANVDIEIPRDSLGAPGLPPTGVDTAGAMYALTPHGTAFSTPATVQIPFDSTRIPTDADPVLYKAEQGGAFSPIPTTLNGNMLSANVSNFSWVIPGFASKLPRMVYALTSGNDGLSVSSFKINKGAPELSAPTSSAPVGSGAISVTVHPSRRFLYVTNGNSGVPGTDTNVPSNSISVYQLDAVTGAVSGPTDVQPVNGNPVSVVVHPTGKFIYVVNDVKFGTPVGNISVFSIDSTTGALSGSATTADSAGAPATAIAFAPSGEFGYVTYLHAVATPVGNTFWDTVKTYSVNAINGQLSGPIGSANTGDNPWAIAVTPSGKFAYVASLSDQGSLHQISVYSIDQTSGTLTLRSNSGFDTINSPGALAMDSEGRFLYVGLQGIAFVPQFNANINLEVYSIDSTSGVLTLVAGAATTSNPGGPIAVKADPQAQFIFAMDDNGVVVPYAVDRTSGALTAGPAISGVFLGGASGGVGDPFQFGVSGTSPVWQDNCTVLVDNFFVFDGCPTGFMSNGPGTGGGGGSGSGGTPPPPAASFVLTVLLGSAGGSVLSSPAGIDYNPAGLNENFFQHAFPNGSSVTLTATPPDTAQSYDVKWTGACSGDTTTSGAFMNQDRNCYVSFTPVSSR